MKKNIIRKLLVVSVLMIFVSACLTGLMQTSFGKVEIINFKLPTEQGQWLSGQIFKPEQSTAEHKVPLVITEHGYLNNKHMQDLNAIELSRRGIAVMTFDAYYHGKSSSASEPVMEAVAANGEGMIPLVEFAYQSLDYIDNQRIGVMGHSMGGMSAWLTLMHYGSQYYAAIDKAKAPDSEGGERITDSEQEYANSVNKVAAGLPVGNIRLSSEKVFSQIHANMGIIYGQYDEGNYDLLQGNGDLSNNADEALVAVHSIVPETEHQPDFNVGQYYGNAENQTLRVVYNPKQTHEWAHFSKTTVTYTVDFFSQAFEISPQIKNTNQIWIWKELVSLIGILGIFLLILPAAYYFLEIPFFKQLKLAKEQRSSKANALQTETNKKKTRVFWVSWTLNWIFSAVGVIVALTLDKVIFKSTSSFISVKWFAQPITNYILIWAMFSSLIGAALFVWKYKLEKRNNAELTFNQLGIKISLRNAGKTFILALCIYGIFFGIVYAAEYLLNADFKFWILGVFTFDADKLLVWLNYSPFFFIFYLVNALLINKLSYSNIKSEKGNMIVAGIGSVLGIMLINGIQYAVLFTTGNAFWQETRLYPMVLLPFIFLLFTAAIISRSLYKLTGNVWLGAMVNTLIITMIGVANTATLAL
ncbi:alpha/beta fold hydrolase [Paenibacillus tritici]|uniref:alpha/beta hydrolase family protein n=1 Tax=Paenibacillus tritici TaxID=1873425 RepID=UPI001BA88B17|nr:alpha/beta fold hydrolase [Paenibacillus tritici]QUL52248.1 alpha/beta fold hydrolase [Paenibacillus tritici]